VLLGRAKRRQEQRDQERNNPDHDEELDKRKTV
jgi:hypothetical protein